ncbi:MAG: RNA-binding S4 domain-containing protein [Clostridia bacterium]|nr:RNA-binding S4 domain-containing protein [Clostridia bacterium]
MRLDKFLKVSRLIKRRTVANDACDSQRVWVNGKQTKPSYDVNVGDEIKISFGTKLVTVKVLDIRETTKKSEAVGMYEIIAEEVCGIFSRENPIDPVDK